ncbi:MAG TPA: ribosome biogenesis GTP-binding protein YihA/YsxC [Bacteroidia bacterium]|nr:ribosome biogenesis GTP-binding protein YihA/YsxC [Bacteroidia bacterium]HNT79895.1 ribosome biogenesis GTP-binding protein YihA/YsxC [Bacteroidia bacterium]
MIINDAVFVQSSKDHETCPSADKAEFVFIGRSNVGKSSLINYLLNRKSLALVSSTPGKTQMINHFLINKQWYLVDMPGYGYAKRSKKLRSKWEKTQAEYLQKRKNLVCAFVLMDINVSPMDSDMMMLDQLAEWNVPAAVVFTKSDKLKKVPLERSIQAYEEMILENWEALPPIFISSASKKIGADMILNFIKDNIDIYSRYQKNR